MKWNATKQQSANSNSLQAFAGKSPLLHLRHASKEGSDHGRQARINISLASASTSQLRQFFFQCRMLFTKAVRMKERTCREADLLWRKTNGCRWGFEAGHLGLQQRQKNLPPVLAHFEAAQQRIFHRLVLSRNDFRQTEYCRNSESVIEIWLDGSLVCEARLFRSSRMATSRKSLARCMRRSRYAWRGHGHQRRHFQSIDAMLEDMFAWWPLVWASLVSTLQPFVSWRIRAWRTVCESDKSNVMLYSPHPLASSRHTSLVLVPFVNRWLNYSSVPDCVALSQPVSTFCMVLNIENMSGPSKKYPHIS